ncbi:histidine phosphatase family protein [Fulvivirgaceae bacterium BMA10]|uniref:Histidine phosphatase family protein n=2 Tax=Splendidivirga corallicola TaxID=3051826 RepID=A0ABT8KHU0_9BACT|nr:histidine phosphatase family protein [Fulvivirgaceae bacterium BMA10]
MQILLIRHGEPNLKKWGWKNRKAAKKFVHDYDSVGIIAFKENPICIENLVIDKAFHSSLPRAKHTAELLFDQKLQLVEKPEFREFERKLIKFINVPLPLKFWTGSSRLLWLMGLNDKHIESFKDAKQRVEKNARFLENDAKYNKDVVLVAHGFHNRYVKKALKRSGWKEVRKGGNGYLSISILAKYKEYTTNN